ncbi:hypothetical protein SAMN02745121_05404 [Nannocystis exedens]|uniref:Uncharacterized protein n=1 Tax=Nannocystis exedens TaxID=54 RepID=A0A1I2D771_9BACT|nr:hypothetical protein [Nannocystis exedens]PCC70711.1 hypothetical protein NAEX_03775 [Nannocystis exedens]SFE75943.1 hypothetical protein SAMN02745121_05404 [Nannocystis exedens]
MTDRSDRFSDRLLELEQTHTTAALRERHRLQVEAMLVRPLSPPQRLLHAAVATAGLAGAGVCAALVVSEPATLAPLTRAALTLCAGFGASWSLWAVGVLRRGAVHRRRDRGAAARMAFGFTLVAVLMVAALAAASPGPASPGLLAMSLALLVTAAVVLLMHAIEQEGLRGREHMLALQLQVLELTASVRGRDGDCA